MKKIVYLCSAIVIMLLMVSQISHAQSSNPNYITTETFLDSLGTKKVTSVQYYDGLGRPNVLATNGLSPNRKYVYTMTEYDNMGREAKTWLPAVGTTSPVFISTSTMSTKSQNTYEGDAYAYSEVTYDTLGRPVFVSTPGDAWYQAGTKEENTWGMINVIRHPKIHIISHPGDGSAELDFEKLVGAAKDAHTLLEINNHSLAPQRKKSVARDNNLEILRLCKKYDVPTILGSDAHISFQIADYERLYPLIEETDFPDELIMNYWPDKFISYLGIKE